MFQSMDIGEIYVTDPVEITSHLTLSVYTIYKIRTDALPDAIVERTYKDFVWLSEQIYADYPGFLAPALPEEYNPSFIDNRRQALETYLNRLSRHKVLRKSFKLETFLLGNDASLASLKERSSLFTPLIVGTTWFSKTFSFFEVESLDRMSRHKAIDKIFAYVNLLDSYMENLVTRITAQVENSCHVTNRYFEVAQAMNLLGELEEGFISTDIVDTVNALTEVSQAYEVYSQSLSEDVEEPIREYHRMMFSIRQAIISREEAWSKLINSKALIVTTRDKLSKSMMLSRIIGREGREGIVDELSVDLERAVEEERTAQCRLESISDTLVLEFKRFLLEKREDVTRIAHTLVEIEVLFAKRRAQIWRELIPKLEVEPIAPVVPEPSPRRLQHKSRRINLPKASSVKTFPTNSLPAGGAGKDVNSNHNPRIEASPVHSSDSGGGTPLRKFHSLNSRGSFDGNETVKKILEAIAANASKS